MTEEGPPDISGLLAAWNNRDNEALSHLIPCVYPELRRIARRHLGRRPAGHTLESAALANEAFLKLTRAGAIRCENRVHFLALCSQIIRRILVDHARSRGYAKRGGNAVHVPLDDVLLGARARGIEVLALDEALQSLSRIDARKGRVVELSGLSVEETAEVLQISPETAKRDWRMAKTWLFSELTGKKGNTSSYCAGLADMHQDNQPRSSGSASHVELDHLRTASTALLHDQLCHTHRMSKRLQVLLPDQDMSEIQRLAKRDRLTVGEWVRRALREARSSRPMSDPETKLRSIRRAAKYSFPTADVEQMLNEIEQGYQG